MGFHLIVAGLKVFKPKWVGIRRSSEYMVVARCSWLRPTDPEVLTKELNTGPKILLIYLLIFK
jgi:hypothetical protein